MFRRRPTTSHDTVTQATPRTKAVLRKRVTDENPAELSTTASTTP